LREWRDIVQEAVNSEVAKRGGSVPGSTLKIAILRLAGREVPSGKFADFLKQFSDIISIIHRQGQDILVIPKENVFLPNKDGDVLNIRHDMYKAFAFVDDTKTAYYNRELKYIEWFSANEKPVGSQFVPIPPRTVEAEIKVREQFANTINQDEGEQLLFALTTVNRLGAFSTKLRELNLFQEWLSYRSKELLERIRRWASENSVYWDDSWIQSRTENVLSPFVIQDIENNKLAAALAGLGKEDMSRIVIPLDLVLKLLKIL
jgi:hypothetical protein